MRILLLMSLAVISQNQKCSEIKTNEFPTLIDAYYTPVSGGPAGSGQGNMYSFSILCKSDSIKFDSLHTSYQSVKIKEEDVTRKGDTVFLNCMIRKLDDKLSFDNLHTKDIGLQGIISYYLEKKRYRLPITGLKTKPKTNLP